MPQHHPAQTPSCRLLALALLLTACAPGTEPAPPQDAATGTSGLEGTVAPHALPLDWDGRATMASPRSAFTLTPLLDGRVLVTGGTGPLRDTVQAGAELYDPATDTWTSAGSLSTTRYGHTATRLKDGRVLVVGGASGYYYAYPKDPLASSELYDPATGTWTPTGSLSEARLLHTATLLPDGKVLVAGGMEGVNTGEEERLASAEVYDPATGTWSPTAPLSGARSGHTATVLPDGRVMVAGGTLFWGPTERIVEVYDPGTGTWARTGSLNHNRRHHTATLLRDGRVLVTGGTGWQAAELYDPATGTWALTGQTLLTRTEHTATLLPDGRVLVVGGANPHDSDARVCEVYDPATGRWSYASALSVLRVGHAAMLLPDGTLFVVGGKENFVTGRYHDSTEVLVPTPGGWSLLTPPAHARSGHTATLLPSGRVLVAGGSGASGALASSELYDPATGAWSATGPLTRARSAHTATLLRTGRVLVVGQGAELYDPATGAWSATASPARPRTGHTSTLLPDGRVLVTGGESSGSALADTELYDPATGVWSATGSLARARSGHTATLLRDGRVLVVGGGASGKGGVTTEPAELYDPATGVWSPTPSLARVHSGHTATLLPSGKVLVVDASAEVYDPVTGAWIATDVPSQPRSGHTATLLPSGAVLVAGGAAGSGATPRAELYDPARGTWSRAAPLPDGRHGHTATLLASGAVLVVGGRDASGPVAAAVLHTRATGTWAPSGPLLSHSGLHTTTLLPSGKVLLVGGTGGTGGIGYQTRTELYDPATGTWSAAGPLSMARAEHTATLLHSGKVLVVGGLSSKARDPESPYSPVFEASTAELYDPDTNTWTPTAPLAHARFRHTATLLHSGKVLVVGGLHRADSVGTPELYDPDTGTWTPVEPVRLRHSHTATLLRDGRVLVLQGGGDGDIDSMSAQLYDPSSGAWTPTRVPSGTRHWHKATLLPSGKVLLTGGRGPRYTSFSDTELYDPATGTWEPTGPLTQPLREYFITTTLLPSGKVLMTGGERGSAVELYDPATGTWSAQLPTTRFRNDHAATLLTDGRVLVTGGHGAYNYDEDGSITELYEDTGASPEWRPTLTRPAPGELLEARKPFEVEGALLRGLSEASGGNSRSSPTDFPLLTLLDLARNTLYAVPTRDFSSTHASATVPRVPSGHYLLTVSVNGVSAGRVVRIQGVELLDTRLVVPRPALARSATFVFSASEEGASFECSLDGAAFTACASPVSHANLAVGSHTFQVRARDTDGNVDETPARHAWTVTPDGRMEAHPEAGPGATPVGAVEPEKAGGCAAGPGSTSWLLVALALLGPASRRRARR